MLTFSEVCDRLRLDPKTVRKIIRSGKLKASQVGDRGDYRVTEEALAEYLKLTAVHPAVS
jgi:excisionase family DNA binding protein